MQRPVAVDLLCGFETGAMPHVVPLGAVASAETLVALPVGLLDARHHISSEPELPAYARRYD